MYILGIVGALYIYIVTLLLFPLISNKQLFDVTKINTF